MGKAGRRVRPSRRSAGLLLLFLMLILALAAGLRFVELGAQSFWSDEGNSAALATRSLAQISQDAANDIHPPLYYWLLHIWSRAFGVSEVALRSLSALIGVLLVLIIAELGRLLFNDAVGLGAGFVAALSPFQVYYSQEARMYILVALEAAVAVALFWWFVTREDLRLPLPGQRGNRPRLLPFSGQLLVLVWAAGLYTHYAFPLIIALSSGLYVIWLITSRLRGRVLWRLGRWLLLLGLSLGLYAPWLPTAVRQLSVWPGVDASVGVAEQVRTLILTLVLGPAGDSRFTVAALVLFALALLGALPWALHDGIIRTGSARVDWLRLFLPLGLLLAPALMILSLGLFSGSYLKFVLIGSPALAVLVARAALGPTEWLLRTAPLVPPPQPLGITAISLPRTPPDGSLVRTLGALGWPLIVFSLAGGLSTATLNRYFNDPAVARDDYRGIAQFVVATGQGSDAILLSAPGQGEVFEYYYKGDLPTYALPQQRPLDVEDTSAQLEALLAHDKIYAIFWALNEADPEGLIEGWLSRRAYKTLDQWHGNVRMAVYEMPERHPPDEVAENLDVRFGSGSAAGIVLSGYRSWNPTPTAGEVTQVQLLWQADAPPTRRYTVFLQLLDPRDQVIAQRDAEPGGDSRPTTTWRAGELISDNHGLLIPPGTPPGSYRRIVGLYDAETMERLRLPDGSDFVSLPPIQVARSRTPPPLEALARQYTQQFDFGGISLLGHDRYKRGHAHDRNAALIPGDLLHLTFYWRANVEPRADWWFNLTLSDGAGQIVASLVAPLAGPTYATTLWQQQEVVRGEHDLPIPGNLPPDTYRLSLVLLPDAETEAGNAYLGTMKVAAPQPDRAKDVP
jgi:mannosyltransferase